MLTKDRRTGIKQNRKLLVILNAPFIFMLVFLAFNGSFRGVDVTDSTYSLSNFVFLDRLDGMWLYSTFYANLLGKLFTLLPGGTTLLGMKLYTALVKLTLAVASYIFFIKSIGAKHYISFIGVIGALGLCWCPDTILYNYLTYLFFFAGAAFLYKALEQDEKVYFVIAGFMLGSNVFVRLPNVIEAGLIVVLWADSIFRKDKFITALNKTLWCMLGYVISFIPAIILIMFNGGLKAYLSGVTEMFGMSSSASGYGPVEMVLQILRSFWFVREYIAISIAAIVFVTAAWIITRKKSEAISTVLCIPVSALLLIKLYRNGMFTRNYGTYGAFFGIGKIVVFIIYLYMLIVLFRKDRGIADKRLAMMAVMICIITPLGTNNELYSVLNNMFFSLPTMCFLLTKDIKEKNAFKCFGYVSSVLILVLSIQGVLFGLNFSFRDGFDDKMDVKAYGNEVINGVYTTSENARRLADLSAFWQESDLDNGEVLLYGDVSGMGFILNTPIAISTAWPSLESFSEDKFRQDIGALTSKGTTPTVLISNTEYELLHSNNLNIKQEILKNFLETNYYNNTYQDDYFTVLTASAQ